MNDFFTEEEKFQKEKEFQAMANVCKTYMQRWTHPHMAIIVTQSGIELVEGVQSIHFEIVD